MGDEDTRNRRIGFVAGGALAGAVLGLLFNSPILFSAVGMGLGVLVGSGLDREKPM